MTSIQLEIYRYCRMLGFTETFALQVAATLRSRGDLETIRRRVRLLLCATGAALMLTAALTNLV